MCAATLERCRRKFFKANELTGAVLGACGSRDPRSEYEARAAAGRPQAAVAGRPRRRWPPPQGGHPAAGRPHVAAAGRPQRSRRRTATAGRPRGGRRPPQAAAGRRRPPQAAAGRRRAAAERPPPHGDRRAAAGRPQGATAGRPQAAAVWAATGRRRAAAGRAWAARIACLLPGAKTEEARRVWGN